MQTEAGQKHTVHIKHRLTYVRGMGGFVQRKNERGLLAVLCSSWSRCENFVPGVGALR